MSATRRDKLEGHVRTRVALIRELAEGRRTVPELAKKYGVTDGGIRRFRDRHIEEVEHVKANLEDEFAGLLYAKKAARLAEYEHDIETANGEIANALDGRLSEVIKLRGEQHDDATHEMEVVADVSDAVARLWRGKHRALRSIAEELGQLPSRVVVSTDDGAKVRHIVEGVDISKVMGLGNPNAANE